jgi:hypothetical protein
MIKKIDLKDGAGVVNHSRVSANTKGHGFLTE